MSEDVNRYAEPQGELAPPKRGTSVRRADGKLGDVIRSSDHRGRSRALIRWHGFLDAEWIEGDELADLERLGI